MGSLVLSALLQVALGIALAVLLVRLRPRRYPQKHLRYWVLSWTALILNTFNGLTLLLIHSKAPLGPLSGLFAFPAALVSNFPVFVTLLGAVLPMGIMIAVVLAVIKEAGSSEQRMGVYWEASHVPAPIQRRRHCNFASAIV